MDALIRVAELKAGRGAGWLGEAFNIFRRAPIAWIGLCSGWLIITLGLFLVPFIGGVIANFLQPVFFASFAIAAFKQAAGEPVLMGDLFSGFRRNVRALINLGALLLIAEIAIFALLAVMGLPVAGAENRDFTLKDYVESFKGKEWILLLGFVLTAIVKGALWFAPQLIAFHDMGTTQAMRWSVYAAISNLGAMIIYGFSLAALMVVGIIPWGLGLFVVFPMMVISTFVGYREVFEAGRMPASSGT
jgi:hypothetical protein